MFRLLALVIPALLLPAVAQAQETRIQPASTALFNSTEIRSSNLATFTNWSGVLRRFAEAQRIDAGRCAAMASDKTCRLDDWEKIIAEARPLSHIEQLRLVNDRMNSKRYILDPVNWGMDDYWATVFEFLDRNGDCEDYAVSKYVTLRKLGWSVDSIRIVILRDTKLNLNHAILAAYTDEGIYIGDNQVDGIVKASNIRHYKPIYSINENSWWLHRPRAR